MAPTLPSIVRDLLERHSVRPIVVWRRNGLRTDTAADANASTRLHSLIETAKANGLEPYAYLRRMFIHGAAVLGH